MNIQKLNQKLEEMLCEIKEFPQNLYKMATPQGKIKAKVRDLGSQIISHTLKCLIYPENEDGIKHWAIEIENWLAQCYNQKIKNTNKHPSKNQLYSWILESCQEDEMDAYVYGVHGLYKPERYNKNDYNLDLLYTQIKGILKQCLIEQEQGELNTDYIIKIIKEITQ